MVFPRRKKKLIKRIANKHGYTILLLVSEEKCPRFCFCRRPLLFFGHFLKRQRDRFISFHHFFAKFHQRLPTLTCATNPTNNCSLKRGLCLWLDPSLQQWELMELEIKPDTLRYENRYVHITFVTFRSLFYCQNAKTTSPGEQRDGFSSDWAKAVCCLKGEKRGQIKSCLLSFKPRLSPAASSVPCSAWHASHLHPVWCRNSVSVFTCLFR